MLKTEENADGLYFTESIKELIETAMYTSLIANFSPVSLILVGPSGAGKSKVLKTYIGPFIHQTDSISSMGLASIAKSDPTGKIKFLIIPDINPTLSRKSSTVNATMGNLLSITGDGTVRIDDGREDKVIPHAPIGIITACTPEVYEKNAKNWFMLGLRRRIIPVFYSYKEKTLSRLHMSVRSGKVTSSMSPGVRLELRRSELPRIDEKVSNEIEKASSSFATNLGKLPFTMKGKKMFTLNTMIAISPHVTLRAMAMAHAMRRGSLLVTDDDVDFILNFVGFTNPENPVLL